MSFLTKLQLAKAKNTIKNFVEDESGDTNFISIIIILGIVIVLVGVFVAFKDKILGVIEEVVNGFSVDSLGKSAGKK